VLLEATTFKMWYQGDSNEADERIGYATSDDGVHWTRRAEPVLRPSNSGWDNVAVYQPSVVLDSDSGVYHMWYSGHGARTLIGYAVSPDGIHWSKGPAIPSLEPEGEWELYAVNFVSVILDGGIAHMWYTGWPLSPDEPGAVGYASAARDDFVEPPLMLNDSRFVVTSMWWDADNNAGYGAPMQLTADTGCFSFFDPDNLEVVVKVLDGCWHNQRYWVFAAGLTDVGVTLTVTDTETGEVHYYTNPLGDAYQPILDTDAFAACD
jgi:hypothetical protein